LAWPLAGASVAVMVMGFLPCLPDRGTLFLRGT
jgi:hypothetical protein